MLFHLLIDDFTDKTKEFVDKLKIYRRLHGVLGAVTPFLHPPLAATLCRKLSI